MNRSTFLGRLASAAAYHAPKRVLVVDDEATIRDLYARVLRSEGLDVEVACDGEQALLKLAFQPFDLLITDWHMPRLDGASLVQWLRATRSTVPVIMLSGSDAAHDIPKSLQTEFAFILQKPILPTRLLTIVQNLLGVEAKTERATPAPAPAHANSAAA